jgi:NAD(P)-dependent dehydrogenase (short-subunit alcohol dehydrogenase family)
MSRFEGKLAVVAGASSGIGRACAALLEREGAKVATLDLADPDQPVDITDEEAVARFLDELPHAPDVAANAVGDANLELMLEQPVSEFRRIVDVELAGPYIFTQQVARRMVAEGRRGAIVNISSEQESIPSRGLSGHCSAKAGLAMLTKVAAIELGRNGIRVNAVSPGCTNTPLTSFLQGVPTYLRGLDASTPAAARMGEAAEIAAGVAFLLSDEASWVTGISLRVDGGQSLVFVPDVLDALAADAAEVETKVLRTAR